LDEKEVGKGRQEQVMLPAQPTASFTRIEADLAFAFFEAGFDRPAQAAETDKLGQGRRAGRRAEVDLGKRRVVEVRADDQPQVRTGQASASFDHAPKAKSQTMGPWLPS
jgi:hypothetical protein